MNHQAPNHDNLVQAVANNNTSVDVDLINWISEFVAQMRIESENNFNQQSQQ